MLWSDESKYNLYSSDGIKDVRRPKNQREELDPKVREESYTNKKDLFATLRQKWKNMPVN